MVNPILWLIGAASAIWVIYDVAAKQKKMDGTKKAVWIICALLFSVVTAIIYYFMVKRK
ncbi:MAG TPA: PLDc N-terminal domain-containing protein [Candidatus Nanoarchaeia archaeon]|nr:PLDc N-terminal domain-containing protein [Candidatus Nanoarchaeia archaeon]